MVAYAPETGALLGAVGSLTYREGASTPKPDTMTLVTAYTTNRQFVAQFQPDLYFDRGRLETTGTFTYALFPDRFFGVGNDTDVDDGETYVPESIVAQPSVMRTVFGPFRAGVQSDFTKSSMLEIERGGLLDTDAPPGVKGYRISGLGLALDFNDLDHPHAPSRGRWFRLRATFYRRWMGSEFEFFDATLDLRHFFTLRPDWVLAVQAQWRTRMGGAIPFQEIPRLDELRGILGSRFRDRRMVLVQAEVRFPIHWRFRGVVFLAAGDVNHHTDAHRFREIKYAAGLGLRFLLIPEEHVTLRLDFGFSPWGVEFYFQLLEAF
jgi:hypothetical protein